MGWSGDPGSLTGARPAPIGMIQESEAPRNVELHSQMRHTCSEEFCNERRSVLAWEALVLLVVRVSGKD